MGKSSSFKVIWTWVNSGIYFIKAGYESFDSIIFSVIGTADKLLEGPEISI